MACEAVQTKDSVALVLISPRRPPPRVRLNDGFVQRVLSCLPFKVKRNYVAHAFDPHRQLLTEFNAFRVRRNMEQQLLEGTGTHEVVGNSQADLMRKLHQLGFDRSCIHQELGGDKGYSHFAQWMRMRISLEGIMSSTPIMRNNGLAAVSAAAPTASTAIVPAAATASDTSAKVTLLVSQMKTF